MRERLARDVVFATRMLLVLYDEQTEEEKLAGVDLGIRDGKGFTPFDAERLSYIARLVERTGEVPAPDSEEGYDLKHMMVKYGRQLVKIEDREIRAIQLKFERGTAYGEQGADREGAGGEGRGNGAAA